MSRRLIAGGAVLALVAVAALVWWLRQPEPLPEFEGSRAYALVEAQTDFGPRIPGTPAHDSTRAWLVERLQVHADQVVEQRLRIPDPRDTTRAFEGANIIASWQPDLRRRILLAAHWDTRAVADNDPDPAKRLRPVLGANDGGSGVAVLLEIARLLDLHPLTRGVGVDIVLFDLEDAGTTDPAVADSLRIPFAMGSEMFVLHNPTYRPQWGILLDMVGDTSLRIPKEGYSVRYAPELVDRVWAAARRVEATAFVDEEGAAVQDDHVPFLRNGIPVIDLIQTPFPDTWHTTEDTPARVSPESLEQVGRVVVAMVWGPEADGPP